MTALGPVSWVHSQAGDAHRAPDRGRGRIPRRATWRGRGHRSTAMARPWPGTVLLLRKGETPRLFMSYLSITRSSDGNWHESTLDKNCLRHMYVK